MASRTATETKKGGAGKSGLAAAGAEIVSAPIKMREKGKDPLQRMIFDL